MENTEFQSRAHSYMIPENEEVPHRDIHDLHNTNGNEGEKAVSKLQRRHSDIKVYKEFCDFYARFNMANALANAICERCKGGFAPAEKIVNSNGELYHEQCFVCAQCFQQFPEGLFYEFEGRKYCEHDFQMLFAPCCHQCDLL
ncbi:LIM and senescent cell antigen-like-containing domain protein 1 isoform X7 [Malaclemys terrapin pileata]|uniref:LIM and senescent cell antigen-like-containing domain protein 1 isoform X7 n=1 Tax=Malaclemys terrapin pileata TaxID=2991368 RepID=UPI0023A8A627|nr:LIM and senescent cell antigen-like-containing domain protein 1 isoform X7 [Malaclemys terrapin pileata]